MTAPGWYYAAGDPEGTQRYWDGTQWVGDPQMAQPATPVAQTAPTTAPPSSAPPTGAQPFAATAPTEAAGQLDKRWAFGAIGAAVLALIGTIGPWASLFGVNLNGSETDDGKIVIGAAVIGGFAAAAALLQPAGRKAIRIVYALCGALVLVIFLGNYGDVSDIGIAWGFWVMGLAGVAMLVLGAAGDKFLPG